MHKSTIASACVTLNVFNDFPDYNNKSAGKMIAPLRAASNRSLALTLVQIAEGLAWPFECFYLTAHFVHSPNVCSFVCS